MQNSWGISEEFGYDYEDCDDRWWAVIDHCEAAGVITIWSAGNEGPGAATLRSPADRVTTPTNTYSVGAVDATNYEYPYPIAVWSSRGPFGCNSFIKKPEVAAPGVAVYSCIPDGGYSEDYSGTSMAGPHVAGVVALMWSANPELVGDVERTEQILIESAQPYAGTTDILEMSRETNLENQPEWPEGEMPDLPFNLGGCLDETDISVVPNNIVGHGVVDAYEAVRMALEDKQ